MSQAFAFLFVLTVIALVVQFWFKLIRWVFRQGSRLAGGDRVSGYDQESYSQRY